MATGAPAGDALRNANAIGLMPSVIMGPQWAAHEVARPVRRSS